jgi:hypothetical protein
MWGGHLIFKVPSFSTKQNSSYDNLVVIILLIYKYQN